MRYLIVLASLVVSGCIGPVSGPATPEPATPIVAPLPADDGRRLRNPGRSFRQLVGTMEPVIERECRQMAPELNCDFRIILDDRPDIPPNAFQTLDENGRPILGFTEALILDVNNIDELAFVMGHEAAHHIAGHLARQEQNARLGAAVFAGLAEVTGVGGVETAQQLGAAVGARSYSKAFELEADELGTILTARAGYDPVRGAAYFTRIPDPGNRFLGTHPPNAARISIVQQTAARL